MRKYVVISAAAVLSVAGAAAGRPTFVNGPYVTGIGNGPGGANTSTIDPTHNSFGIGSNELATPATGGPIRVADDFTVTDAGGWDISSATFYMYQTIATPPTSTTITSVRIGVYNSVPSGTDATPDSGDFSTNRMTSALFSGVYRVTSTTLTNDDRAIWAITCDMSWLSDLAAGTYWLAWSTTGTSTSGPWQVPVTPAAANHNARQFFDPLAGGNGSWAQIDGNSGVTGVQPLDLVFDLQYTVVPTPGAVMLLAGAGLVQIRRRR